MTLPSTPRGDRPVGSVHTRLHHMAHQHLSIDTDPRSQRLCRKGRKGRGSVAPAKRTHLLRLLHTQQKDPETLGIHPRLPGGPRSTVRRLTATSRDLQSSHKFRLPVSRNSNRPVRSHGACQVHHRKPLRAGLLTLAHSPATGAVLLCLAG